LPASHPIVSRRSRVSFGWLWLPTWPGFKGSSREHTESDLRCCLTWCAERGLDPLTARRPHLELYIRWMQEIRRFQSSTVSRRFSVAAGFCRTCVIDGLLEHSPAEHVRRPSMAAESPTLGFTHLQFEALLIAARTFLRPGGRIHAKIGQDREPVVASPLLRDLAGDDAVQAGRVEVKLPARARAPCWPSLAGVSSTAVTMSLAAGSARVVVAPGRG